MPRKAFPHISISVETESLEVQSIAPSKVPDKAWTYVDKAGHGHFWGPGEKTKNLPTLKWVVTGTEWVGDEFDHSEIEVGEYRCRFCDEVIEPGMKLQFGPQTIPGLTWFTVEVNGEAFRLTPEQYSEVLAEWLLILRESYRAEA